MSLALQPTRLRPQVGAQIGTTAFFRNRALLASVLDQLSLCEGPRIDILFHAASIGAEAYSLLIAARLDPRFADRRINCHICDLQPRFLEIAHQGRYPASILAGMRQDERAFFTPAGEGQVQIDAGVRAQLEILTPCSFVDFGSDQAFDMVAILNALIYVDEASQARAIDRVAQYNKRLFVATAFHMPTIKTDLQRNGYKPVLTRQKEIHEGWSDRRVAGRANELVPGVIFHPWSLPPYQAIADHEYKYCALFSR